MTRILIAAFGLVKIFVIKIFHPNNLSFNHYIKVSPSSRIELLKNGKINIKSGVSIGKDTELAVVEGILDIGNNVHIGDYNILIAHDKIIIGDNTMFGPHVYIFDHDHMIKNGVRLRDEYKTAKICIGKNVWIGANTVILRGTTIGDNCVIAAGSVVYGDIPSNSTFVQKRNIYINGKEYISEKF